MKRFQKSMITGPLLPNIISYTIPIILTSLLQLLFHAADLVVVGRYHDSTCVGAVGATGALTSLIINLFMGISVGVGVSVAHAIGSREKNHIHRCVHTAIPMALVCGVVLTVVGVSVSGPMLKVMSTPVEQLAMATTYMQIYFLGITFTMVYNFAAAILRAAGDTKSPLIFLSISGVINVGLNFLFVAGMGMKVEGVAIATVVSQGVSAVMVLWTLMRRQDDCRLELRKMRIYSGELKKILRIGLPAGVQNSLFSISNVILQSSVNSLAIELSNPYIVDGNAAASNLDGFIYVTLNAFQQTAVNFVGQNWGARQQNRVKKILGICLTSVAAVGIAMGVSMYLFREPLLSIYIKDAPAAIEAGSARMLVVALPYFLCGMMEVTTGVLRGIGSSVLPMIISVVGVCGIRIAWCAAVFPFPAFHNLQGLFISYIVSWSITFLAQLLAFTSVFRRRTAQMTDTN